MHALLQFLLRSVAFLLFAAMTYALGIAVWGVAVPPTLTRNLVYPKGGYGHMWSRLREVEDHGPVDIVVLGNSIAYRGFDPRQFAHAGFSLFNLGSSSQSFMQTEVLVDRYMDRLNPKLVIIEVAPGSFQLDGVEAALDLLANGGIDRKMASMAWHVGGIKVFNAMIFSFIRQTLQVDRNYSEPNADPGGENKYIPGGFVEHVSGGFSRTDQPPLMPMQPRPDQLAAFERIIDKLREEGRAVVLVEAPQTQWLTSSYLNHRAHSMAMSAQASYINMNGLEGLNDTIDFYDENHLNQHGVVLFDRALLDSLGQHGLLPLRQGEP